MQELSRGRYSCQHTTVPCMHGFGARKSTGGLIFLVKKWRRSGTSTPFLSVVLLIPLSIKSWRRHVITVKPQMCRNCRRNSSKRTLQERKVSCSDDCFLSLLGVE